MPNCSRRLQRVHIRHNKRFVTLNNVRKTGTALQLITLENLILYQLLGKNIYFLEMLFLYDYDYDYEMVLLRHTISTMYHGIIFKSCKKHNILQ